MSGFFTVCKDVRISDINCCGFRKMSESCGFLKTSEKKLFYELKAEL